MSPVSTTNKKNCMSAADLTWTKCHVLSYCDTGSKFY